MPSSTNCFHYWLSRAIDVTIHCSISTFSCFDQSYKMCVGSGQFQNTAEYRPISSPSKGIAPHFSSSSGSRHSHDEGTTCSSSKGIAPHSSPSSGSRQSHDEGTTCSSSKGIAPHSSPSSGSRHSHDEGTTCSSSKGIASHSSPSSGSRHSHDEGTTCSSSKGIASVSSLSSGSLDSHDEGLSSRGFIDRFFWEQKSSLSESETIIFLHFFRWLFAIFSSFLSASAVVSPAQPVLASFSPQVAP